MSKSNIVDVMESDLLSLNMNIKDLITNYSKMENEILELRTLVEHYRQDIKLKDSQIAAFERSAANKLKMNQQVGTLQHMSPEKKQDNIEPPLIERPKTPGPNYVVVIQETVSDKTINSDYKYVLPDNYCVFELDGEKYYRNLENDELYKYMNISELNDLYMVGKLKLFKIKNGKQYITNTANHKVYNYSDDDEILDYCGDIINGKFKLH